MGELIRLPLPEPEQETKSKGKNRAYKTEMTDDELYKLLCQYAHWWHLKFKHEYKLHTEEEDILGELAVKAMEAKQKFKGESNLRTFLVKAFAARMANYRKYLNIRQRKYPMKRIVGC